MALVFVGGLLGGLCGGVAFAVNVKIYRANDIPPVLQYFITAVISLTAIILYIALAIFFAQAVS